MSSIFKLLVVVSIALAGGLLSCGYQNENFSDIRKRDVVVVPQNSELNVRPVSVDLLAANKGLIFDFAAAVDGTLYGEGSLEGGLYTSRDGGSTWQIDPQFPFDKTVSVKSTAFLNGMLVLSDSNGTFWQQSTEGWKTLSKSRENQPVSIIRFVNSTAGYAVNRTNYGVRIFKTNDGGHSWKNVYENPISGTGLDLMPVDEMCVLVAINDEYILRTIDGGKTWKPETIERTDGKIAPSDWIDQNTNGAAAFAKTNDGKIWLCGEKGSLYYSIDQGLSWTHPTHIPELFREGNFLSIDFSPDGKGVVVGASGLLGVSVDGGNTWRSLDKTEMKDTLLKNPVTNLPDGLVKVKYVQDHFYIVGNLGMYRLIF